MRQEVKDWIESAEYDLEMAKVMLEAKRSNSCVLMGHQAVETIPRTQNRLTLLQMVEPESPEEIQSTRWHDIRMWHRMYNEHIAQEFLRETGQVLQWLKTRIPSSNG